VTFHELVAAFALGRLQPGDLPAAALQGMLEGYVSDDLGALAGASSRATWSELLDAWHRVLAQLEVSVPTRAEAGLVLRDHFARRVAEGTLPPSEGAAEIDALATHLSDVLPPKRYVGDGLGVAEIVGLYHSHDDVGVDDVNAHAEIDAALLDACRALLRHG
jgi:hypothetical protein